MPAQFSAERFSLNARRRLQRYLCNTSLATAAMAGVGLVPLIPVQPAHAACVITGTGGLGALDANDIVNCTGLGNTTAISGTNANNVQVNIGNGATATSLGTAASSAVQLQTSPGVVVNVTNNATVTAGGGFPVIWVNSDNGVVNVQAGGLVQAAGVGASAVLLNGGNATTVNIGGTADGGANGNGVETTAATTGAQINVLAGGTATGETGVFLDAAGTISNSGTISSTASSFAIIGSSGADVVVNAGTITTAGATAVNLAGGNDHFFMEGTSSITGRVLGGANSDTLYFTGGTNATFNLANLGAGQQFDEFESLTKAGASTWTLTGTTAFAGNVAVNQGRLVVNGTLPGTVTVAGGGILGGAGTIATLVADNNGTLAPGNSIGTLNVTGNATFNAGSTYQVEINSAGQSDLVNATGSATINGGTVQIVPLGAGFLANTQYTIVTAAGGVTGTFTTLAPLPAPLVQGQLTYDANNVYFLLQQVAGFGTLTGMTPNQAAVSGALDQASLGGGASAALTNAINVLAPLSATGIKNGLDDLAGQVLADSRRFTADQAGAFQNFIWGSGVQGRGDIARVSVPVASSYAPEPYDPIRNAMAAKAPAKIAGAGAYYSVWAGAYGNWDRTSATNIAFGASSATGGGALGLEYRTDRFTAGVAMGGSTGKLRSADRANSVASDSGHLGLYARTGIGGFDVAAAVSYALASLDSTRAIGFLNQTSTGDWRAQTFAASFGVSRAFGFGNASAEPFAKLDWTGTHHNAFSETGAPGVNQLLRAGSHDVFSGSTGVRLAYRMLGAGGLPSELGATFGLRHDFSGTAPLTVTSFEGAPGGAFAIGGVARPQTAFLAGGEASWAITRATALKASYDGAFASDYRQHKVSATLRTAF